MGTPVSSGNRGVLALGASLVSLCSRTSHGGRVALLLGNRDDRPVRFRVGGQECLIPVVHARLSPRTHPRHHFLWILLMAILYRIVPISSVRGRIARSTPWIRAVEEAALVGDVRGGDSFSDIYGMKRFILGFLMAWTVVLVRGSMVQFPQTYGPYRRPLARWLARFLLRRSSVIIARDRESQKVAQELVGPEQEVLLSPDVAFSLEVVRPERIELDPPIRERLTTVSQPDLESSPSEGIIGLNVNGLMFNGGYTRDNMFGLELDYRAFLPALVTALLREHTGELWLVPHTYAPPESVESDPEACRRVREVLPRELQGRVRIVVGEYDAHEIKGVIGQCDFFIGSRMHACIAALSQGVPCVGVAYSMKFAGVFESAGRQEWVVDGRSVDTDAAVARVLELYRGREIVRGRLKVQAQAARDRLVEIFRKLLEETGRAPIHPSATDCKESLSASCS